MQKLRLERKNSVAIHPLEKLKSEKLSVTKEAAKILSKFRHQKSFGPSSKISESKKEDTPNGSGKETLA
ncbi:hypothetical protein ACJIZ3_024659 [Penstemon smallii]|uniref:Uncharacterized protein n=1 Tax=Penstemon smallii TaxID=265156 RepID=A0ABD3TUP5_9LAMI